MAIVAGQHENYCLIIWSVLDGVGSRYNVLVSFKPDTFSTLHISDNEMPAIRAGWYIGNLCLQLVLIGVVSHVEKDGLRNRLAFFAPPRLAAQAANQRIFWLVPGKHIAAK